jgi:hypothetical protein
MILLRTVRRGQYVWRCCCCYTKGVAYVIDDIMLYDALLRSILELACPCSLILKSHCITVGWPIRNGQCISWTWRILPSKRKISSLRYIPWLSILVLNFLLFISLQTSPLWLLNGFIKISCLIEDSHSKRTQLTMSDESRYITWLVQS